MTRLLLVFAIQAYVAGAAVGAAAPALGCFIVQRRLSLIGDATGHLAFAGVALGVALGIAPLWGAPPPKPMARRRASSTRPRSC